MNDELQQLRGDKIKKIINFFDAVNSFLDEVDDMQDHLKELKETAQTLRSQVAANGDEAWVILTHEKKQ